MSRRNPQAHPARRRRLLAASCLGLLTLPVGLAHMAANSVPLTYAGEAEVPITVATELVADTSGGPDLLTAALSTDEGPVVGAPVDFRLGGPSGPAVCEDVLTDDSGSVVCDIESVSVPDTGSSLARFTVVFDGQGSLAAASDWVDVAVAPEVPEPLDPVVPPDEPSPDPDRPTMPPDDPTPPTPDEPTPPTPEEPTPPTPDEPTPGPSPGPVDGETLTPQQSELMTSGEASGQPTTDDSEETS